MRDEVGSHDEKAGGRSRLERGALDISRSKLFTQTAIRRREAAGKRLFALLEKAGFEYEYGGKKKS